MAKDTIRTVIRDARARTVLTVLMLTAVLGTAQTTQDGAEEPEPPPSPTLIQLVDPLDEPQFYCVDVPGFGASLNLDGALTAHTCKPRADDELFTVGHPSAGHLYMPAYDRCVQAGGATAGAELHLEACADVPLQRFILTADGQLPLEAAEGSAAETVYCLAVEPGEGQPTGGPSHLRRGLILTPCADAAPSLTQWLFPGVLPEPQQ
ncbi:MAG: hypothetical protein OXC31_15870 [Spirochaetaceae bacterium]|nr:hypothetical protein [Spirochaetaceae bacterium]